MTNPNSQQKHSQDNSKTFLYSSAKNVQKLDSVKIPSHPAIQQLFALGYEVGDRVVGRNILVRKEGNKKNVDWAGTLTKDNIIIQEYTWKNRAIVLDGETHQDGLDWLHDENYDKQIYFNVNGERKKENVQRWYAIFFEEDFGTHAEQQAKIDAIPILPSVQVRTRKSNHTYFTVWADETDNIQEWSKYQEIVAYTMGSDPSLKDAPRIMRLAGFDHIKDVDNKLEFVPCTLEQYGLDRIYSTEEVLGAFAKYAEKNGIKPFTNQRFRACQYILHKLRLEEARIYYHPLFNAKFFRTCEDSEISDRLQRCKNWARLCGLRHKSIDCADPETAWTDPIEEIKRRIKREEDFETVSPRVKLSEPLTVQWAKKYTEDFHYEGRNDWHTCKCPVHGGHSDNSLHINSLTGALKCHSGCDSHDIELLLRQMAKDAGDETWNWTTQTFKKSEINAWTPENPADLDKFVMRPNYTKIEFTPVIKDGRTELNVEEILPKLPRKGIVVVIAPTGSGKTVLVDALINQKHPLSAVVSLAPTIMLNKYMCSRLKLVDRNELAEVGRSENAKYERRIGLVYPSLHQLKGRDYKSLSEDPFVDGHQITILDEVRDGTEFVIDSKECERGLSGRGGNLKEQRILIENSDLVVILDAYATNLEVDYISSLNPGLPVYVVELSGCLDEARAVRVVNWVEKKDVFFSLMKDLMDQGKNIIYASDARGKLADADLVFLNGLNVKTFRMDSTTSGEKEQQMFISNPDAYLANEKDLRFLGYSPSMASGVSITRIPEQENTVLFVYSSHFSANKTAQLMGRVRLNIPAYIHVTGDKKKTTAHSSSPFVAVQKKAMLDHLSRSAHEVLDMAMARVEVNGDTFEELTFEELARKFTAMREEITNGTSVIADITCKIRARKSYQLTNRKAKMKERLLMDGYNVNYDNYGEKSEVTHDGVMKQAMKDAAEIRIEKEAKEIVKAEELTDAKFEVLKRKGTKTPQEIAELTKAFFNRQFPEFLNRLSQAEQFEFFTNYVKDGGNWVKTVVKRWALQNQDLIKTKECNKLVEAIKKQHKDKIDITSEMSGNQLPLFQILRETKFFEVFAVGEKVTLKKVIEWAFKLNSEADTEEIIAYAQLKEITPTQKKEFKDKFIAPLDSRYKRELADKLNISISDNPKLISQLVKKLGYFLARFGYDNNLLKQNDEGRVYVVIDADNNLQKTYREMLEDALSKNAQKMASKNAQSIMVEPENQPTATKGLYIDSNIRAVGDINPYAERVSPQKTGIFEGLFENAENVPSAQSQNTSAVAHSIPVYVSVLERIEARKAAENAKNAKSEVKEEILVPNF